VFHWDDMTGRNIRKFRLCK